MKKTLILAVIFSLEFGLLVIKEKTFAYTDCSKTIIYPQGVSTINLSEYILNNNINNIYQICSYENCYNVRESNIKKTVNNIDKLYSKYLSEDELLVVKVKGHSITKIVYNAC